MVIPPFHCYLMPHGITKGYFVGIQEGAQIPAQRIESQSSEEAFPCSLGMAAYIQQNGPDGGVTEPATQNYTNFLFLDSLASDNISQTRQTDPQPQSPSEPAASTDCLNENHVNVIFSREEAGSEPQITYEEADARATLREQGCLLQAKDKFPEAIRQ